MVLFNSCAGVRVSVLFLVRFGLLFGHRWERAAHSVDLMFSLTICYFSYFCFGFDGWVWVLITSVPGLCILFTLKAKNKIWFPGIS